MHCLPATLAGERGSNRRFRCIQCNQNLAPTMFPVLRRDGRTFFLSERCRECEAVIAGRDGVVEVALHLIWRDSWVRCRSKQRSPEFTLRFDELRRLWMAQR